MRAALLLALLAIQQAPARDARPAAAAGTASISGKVVDAESGEPIAGAVLTIGQLKIGERHAAIDADERGIFTLSGLAAGDYIVYASPPELHATHLPAVLNGGSTSLAGLQLKPSLTLTDGEQRTDVVFKLERALAIEGRVVDEFGEPMAEMQVFAERLEGAFGFGGGTGQYTDDRGAFRVYGLSPAVYRVCASPSGIGGPMPRATSGDVVDRRYVKTCYPSSPEGAGERITLTARGAPVLTIVMQRVTGYTISGRVRSESGAANVRASIGRNTGSGSASVNVEMLPDGRFIARGVPPGDYVVTAHAADTREPFGDMRPAELARLPVRVEAADVTGLDLTTTKGATIVGRIVAEQPLPSGTKLLVRPAATLAPMMMMEMPRPAPARADFSFEMTGVHDPLLVDVQGLPAGWVVASVRYHGAEIVDVPTRVATTTEPSELEIVVSPRSASVTARPVDAAGQLVSGAIVLLVPATSDRVMQPRNVGMFQETSDRPFEMPPVRGGDYLVIAVPMIDMMQVMRGSDAVARMRQLGSPITLKPGEKRVIDVVVRSLSEVK